MHVLSIQLSLQILITHEGNKNFIEVKVIVIQSAYRPVTHRCVLSDVVASRTWQEGVISS